MASNSEGSEGRLVNYRLKILLFNEAFAAVAYNIHVDVDCMAYIDQFARC